MKAVFGGKLVGFTEISRVILSSSSSKLLVATKAWDLLVSAASCKTLVAVLLRISRADRSFTCVKVSFRGGMRVHVNLEVAMYG
jgi:hypothetical protein